jgi:hypothetical protein
VSFGGSSQVRGLRLNPDSFLEVARNNLRRIRKKFFMLPLTFCFEDTL